MDGPAVLFLKETLFYKGVRYLKNRWLQRKYARNSYDKLFAWECEKPILAARLFLSRDWLCQQYFIRQRSALNKTGVDLLCGGNVRKTSDEFFRANKAFFDVIFVNGAHTYEQVREDAINSIKFLNLGGWIAFHDMLRRNWIECNVPIVDIGRWTGDVWKLAFGLSQTDGVDFKIVKIDHGVGVLRLTKDNPKLADLTKELSDKKFSYFYENVSKLPIIEWADAQHWLRNN